MLTLPNLDLSSFQDLPGAVPGSGGGGSELRPPDLGLVAELPILVLALQAVSHPVTEQPASPGHKGGQYQY